MSIVSNSSSKWRIEDWLQKCVEYLNGTAYDAISGNTELLNFSASKTTIIPPIPDYNRIMKRSNKKRPYMGPSSSKVLETDINKKADTRGFETDTFVSKYFESYGPGGIYLTNLKIHELVSKEGKKTNQKHFLPDAKEVYDYLESKAGIEIDGILIHPKIGIVVIEIKAVEYSNERSEQHHNRMPKIIFGEKGVKVQLNNYENFVKELYGVIFEKEIPFPVHKIACAPNADTGETSVTEDIHLFDRNAFNENGENFQLFWNRTMTLETEASNRDFIRFAAVLITLKTAFGFVSTFNSNIISTSYDFLNEQKSLLDDTARKQQMQVKQQNKVVYFWLNSEQLSVYEYNPGKHFIMGPPGSGKTLLIKVRMLKFRERAVRIFCPDYLTFQYQQFICDNELQDKVKVLSFSELINSAKSLKIRKTEGGYFHESRYEYILSPDIDIYCDEMDDKTYKTEKVRQLFELRPNEVETFVIGESPDAFINPIFTLSEGYQNIGYSITKLKTMMRSSLEITEYFLSLNKIAPHHNISAGHSLKFKDVLTISYSDNNDAIQNIINCINIKKMDYKYSDKEGYNYNDMAIITLKYQIDDIKSALNNNSIPTKHIDGDADTPAITILTPFQSKSYEWKMVIVWIDLTHEQALSLAITRASIELIIIKQDAEQKTITVHGKEGQKCYAQAQFSLGMSDDEEQGVLQSDEESVKWLTQAAEQGDVNAQYNLGVKYDQGKGVPQSYEEAFKWYRKAAEQGYANAQFNLGGRYAKGKGVRQSHEEAVIWYRKAAEQGLAQAQYNLAVSYAEGLGVKQSDEEAIKHCEKSAEQGYSKAQCILGFFYEKGRGVPQSDEEAVKWYTKASEQGHNVAQHIVRNKIVNDRYVPKSVEEHQIYCNKVPEEIAAASEGYLGIRYDLGQGVPQSDVEAVKWYRKAAEQGDSQAQFNLGVSYAKGVGVLQSDEEAVKWFRKAAEQGDIQAQVNLGVRYDEGQGVPQSYKEAVKWYTKAAEQGDIQAQVNLGVLNYEGHGVPQSDVEAVKWYRKAAKLGHADAQFNLGVSYAEGVGVLQSDEKAVKWYRKAAEQSHSQAQLFLGVSYAKRQGVPQSDEEAVKWYAKSANQGNAQAQLILAAKYDEGEDVLQLAEAVKWYTKAAEQHVAQAQYNLALMYANGRGVPQSNEEAVKWYTKAAEQHVAQAQYNLALMYANGRGVPQSDEEAIKWFRKAAAQGHAKAQSNLREISNKELGISNYLWKIGPILVPVLLVSLFWIVKKQRYRLTFFW